MIDRYPLQIEIDRFADDGGCEPDEGEWLRHFHYDVMTPIYESIENLIAIHS